MFVQVISLWHSTFIGQYSQQFLVTILSNILNIFTGCRGSILAMFLQPLTVKRTKMLPPLKTSLHKNDLYGEGKRTQQVLHLIIPPPHHQTSLWAVHLLPDLQQWRSVNIKFTVATHLFITTVTIIAFRFFLFQSENGNLSCRDSISEALI